MFVYSFDSHENRMFQVLLVCRVTMGQVLREELRQFNIDPLNLNGTESYTDLTIDQIILQASGGSGSKLGPVSIFCIGG